MVFQAVVVSLRPRDGRTPMPQATRTTIALSPQSPFHPPLFLRTPREAAVALALEFDLGWGAGGGIGHWAWKGRGAGSRL